MPTKFDTGTAAAQRFQKKEGSAPVVRHFAAGSGCDNARRNVFSRTGFVRKILAKIPTPVSPSPTGAITPIQDNNNRAVRLFSDFP
ncbi:MAG: hypothetical protein ACRECP_12630 [Methylocella sp.]